MKKIVKFTKENFDESLNMLQPITPQNNAFPAHWWNEGIGKIIKTKQYEWIKKFKEEAKEVKGKIDINKIFKKISIYPEWPEVGKTFWTKGFGTVIQKEWDQMIDNWILYINSLYGSEF